MRLWYGLVGAVLGSALGGAAAVLAAIVSENGHLPDGLFKALAYAPFFLGCGAFAGGGTALFFLRYFRGKLQDGQVKRRSAHILSSLVLTSCVAISAMLWSAQRYTLAPSDQQLISKFEHHHAAFDTLISMAKADKDYIAVNSSTNIPEGSEGTSLSQKRVAEYRRMLSTADLHGRFTAETDVSEGYEADLSCWSQGSSLTEVNIKGYAYLSRPPDALLNSLDDFEPDKNLDGAVYRHLQGNWYLYYSHIP